MTKDQKFYNSSEITPTLTTQNTQTGIRRSTTGSDQTSPSVSLGKCEEGLALSSWENDKTMQASLPQSVNSALSEILDRDFNIVGYSLEAPCPLDDVEKAIKIIDEYSQPLEGDQLTKLLAKLFVKTKRKADDQMSQDLMFAAYHEELIQWPADIVEEVLSAWPRRSMWWPSWHELYKELLWKDKRSKMRKALEKKLIPSKTQNIINEVTKGFTNG